MGARQVPHEGAAVPGAAQSGGLLDVGTAAARPSVTATMASWCERGRVDRDAGASRGRPAAARAPGRGRAAAPCSSATRPSRSAAGFAPRCARRWSGGERSDTEAVAQHSREAERLHRRLRPARPGSLRDLFRLQPPPPGPAAGAPPARRSRRRPDLLDVGCGTGHHLKRARRPRVRRCVGVDGSGAMLAEARGLAAGVPLAQSRRDARCPSRSSSFDAALSVEVPPLPAGPAAAPARDRARAAARGRLLRDRGALAEPQRLPDREPPAARAARLLARCASTSRASARCARSSSPPVSSRSSVHAVYWGPLNWVERLATAGACPASCGGGRRPTRASPRAAGAARPPTCCWRSRAGRRRALEPGALPARRCSP